MFKNAKNLSFSLVLIFVIAVGIYWLMVELQKDYLDHYLSLLGDKLIELVPESSEKRSLGAVFDEFKKQVENQEVTPEQVEQVAAGILNISNLRDSITVAEARAVLEAAKIKPLRDKAREKAQVVVEAQPVKPRDLEVRWKELGERLESIHKFDRSVKNIPDSIRFEFRFDPKLNIILDEQARAVINGEHLKEIKNELRELEEERAVIWKSDLSKQMKNLRVQIEVLHKKNQKAAVAALEKIAVLDPEYNIDSLSAVLEKLGIDSINVIIDSAIEKDLSVDRNR